MEEKLNVDLSIEFNTIDDFSIGGRSSHLDTLKTPYSSTNKLSSYGYSIEPLEFSNKKTYELDWVEKLAIDVKAVEILSKFEESKIRFLAL